MKEMLRQKSLFFSGIIQMPKPDPDFHEENSPQDIVWQSNEEADHDPEWHLRLLSPKTRQRFDEHRQRQKNLAKTRITGYESAPDKDGLEEVRGG